MAATEEHDSLELCFVGDRSASMKSMGDSPWKGVRDWANGQAREAQKKGADTRITVVVFDDESKCVLDSQAVSDWTDITDRQAQTLMKPTGCTRLYDTVIEELGNLRAKQKSRGPRCRGIFALFTDGMDNMSTNGLLELNRSLRGARQSGVICYFLAANQDAIATGHRYGFDVNRCLTTGSDPKTSYQAYKSLNQACYRSSSQTLPDDKGFTQLERVYSAPPPDYSP